MSIAEKLVEIAQDLPKVYDAGFAAGQNAGGSGYDEGYEAGKQAEYDRFWDAYQLNGKKTNYCAAFAGSGWNATTFKPKYPIVLDDSYASAQHMFYNFNKDIYSSNLINYEPLDMTEFCKMIDLSKAKDLYYTFADANAVNITVDASSCTNLGNCFYKGNGGYVDYITIKNLTDVCTIFTNFAMYNADIMHITFIDSVIGANFDMHWSTKLTHDSIMSIINALKDFTGTSTTRTLTLGTTNLAKLTDTEKAVATQKGWTLA